MISRQSMIRVAGVVFAAAMACTMAGCGGASTWATFREEGCKPGGAVVLTVERGIVTAGRCYILDPNYPRDLGHGVGYPIEDLRQSGNTVTGWFEAVNMQSPGGRSRIAIRIDLSKPLDGFGPVAAVARDEGGGEGREMIFTRRGW